MTASECSGFSSSACPCRNRQAPQSCSFVDLSDILPPRDYEFRMGLRRGDPAVFFQPTAEHSEITAERARWLAEDPARYAGLTDGGQALVEEVACVIAQWGAFADPEDSERTTATADS